VCFCDLVTLVVCFLVVGIFNCCCCCCNALHVSLRVFMFYESSHYFLEVLHHPSLVSHIFPWTLMFTLTLIMKHNMGKVDH